MACFFNCTRLEFVDNEGDFSVKTLLIYLISIYQMSISGGLVMFFGEGCFKYPTCSEYAKEAIAKFGPIFGLGLFLRRVVSFGENPLNLFPALKPGLFTNLNIICYTPLWKRQKTNGPKKYIKNIDVS